jgi:hypothetical protein
MQLKQNGKLYAINDPIMDLYDAESKRMSVALDLTFSKRKVERGTARWGFSCLVAGIESAHSIVRLGYDLLTTLHRNVRS